MLECTCPFNEFHEYIRGINFNYVYTKRKVNKV